MKVTKVVMKSGEIYYGVMWEWRPKEGWFSLGGRVDSPLVIRLDEVSLAYEEASIVGMEQDGTPIIAETDWLERAKEDYD